MVVCLRIGVGSVLYSAGSSTAKGVWLGGGHGKFFPWHSMLIYELIPLTINGE
uniref:Uncharacterized protein n=1 Tax=Fagus sylvatica TaxID=28930 RepID=A0A2N9GIP1_FAGSY